MTDTPVATQVHQPLDAHGHFTAQIAFHRQLANLRTQGSHFGIGEVLDQGLRLDAGSGARFA